MATNFEKLQKLLEELFQLDQADLDFGIYRIMNQKRDEVVRFLEKDLLPQVKEAFSHYKSADKTTLQKELDKAIEQATGLGVDPETTAKVKELREQMADSSVDVTALENEVFSHLFNFLRRYYHEGDFLSLRRYKEGVYAIPYEGEEVKLHWANHDQYYVKSSEYFRDYIFTMPSGKRVRVHLVAASSEQDNKKEQAGKERRFVICTEDPIYEENGELFIRFEYKSDNGKKKQDALNQEAIEQVLQSEGFDEWTRELSKPAPTKANPKRTVLEKHLTQYTARNTFDYFIHKDLGGFLRRELDFYIKNEVMHLDDIEHDTVPRVEQYLSKIKVIRKIAHKIIQFLEQLENFQKKLWLKKKFVVETNYCITLDRVPEKLYPEIVANDAQREEWVRLFAIDEIEKDFTSEGYTEPLSVEFLKAYPHLIVDTVFYDAEFRQRMLASIDDIDSNCNGLLAQSDNFQALQLLSPRFKDSIDCVHIDPPYNTATSGFLYKNTFQHSSWLSMMENRIRACESLLSGVGSFLCHIDENEYERLHQLLDGFQMPNAGTVVWDKRNPMNAGQGVATQHEYIVWRTWRTTPLYLRNENVLVMLGKASELITLHGGVTDAARQEFSTWIASNTELSGGEKAYRQIDENGNVYQSVSLRAPEPRNDPKFHIPLNHPKTNKPCPVPPNGFSRTPDTLKSMFDRGDILFGNDHTTQPRQKVVLKAGTRKQLSSVIQEAKKGKADLDRLGLEFPYCHPVSLYEDILAPALDSNDGVVLDFFAGSGTTGHAVLNLNRQERSGHKYVLVELGEHFDAVLKPRILKAVHSDSWKSGLPVERNGLSHFMKYVRLESYEDALNNLKELKPTAQQASLLDRDDDLREQYVLSYMLDVESRGSQSLLNVESFRNPDEYKLRVERDGETQLVNVDLVETFNWLLGLTVKHFDVIRGVRVVEGTNPEGDRAIVLWRNLDETNNDALDEWFKKQKYNTKDQEYDLIYVNGDNNLENLRRGDQTWKVRLIEEEFGRLMFDVQDI